MKHCKPRSLHVGRRRDQKGIMLWHDPSRRSCSVLHCGPDFNKKNSYNEDMKTGRKCITKRKARAASLTLLWH